MIVFSFVFCFGCFLIAQCLILFSSQKELTPEEMKTIQTAQMNHQIQRRKGNIVQKKKLDESLARLQQRRKEIDSKTSRWTQRMQEINVSLVGMWSSWEGGAVLKVLRMTAAELELWQVKNCSCDRIYRPRTMSSMIFLNQTVHTSNSTSTLEDAKGFFAKICVFYLRQFFFLVGSGRGEASLWIRRSTVTCKTSLWWVSKICPSTNRPSTNFTHWRRFFGAANVVPCLCLTVPHVSDSEMQPRLRRPPMVVGAFSLFLLNLGACASWYEGVSSTFRRKISAFDCVWHIVVCGWMTGCFLYNRDVVVAMTNAMLCNWRLMGNAIDVNVFLFINLLDWDRGLWHRSCS